MKFSPHQLILYKKIGSLFFRYARPAILQQTEFAEATDLGERDAETMEDPVAFAQALEDMGPTFVKLGQLLSTRGDLLPQKYLTALERLQDDVAPIPYDEVEKAVENGLGGRISNLFQSFEREPLGSASLGQVHRARMRDGREVVVKIQRPDIRKGISDDLEALTTIAEYADEHTELGRKYHFSGIIEQFRRSLMDELDYLLEAQNLSQLGRSLEEFPNIVVPDVVPSYCSSKVLTMDFIEGTKITELPGVVRSEVDGDQLADELFRSYLHQVLVTGLYHADPHPGNLLLTRDHRVALIDLGMVGRLDEKMKDNLLALLAAIGDNRSEKVAEIAVRISGGESSDAPVDRNSLKSELANLVGRSQGASVDQLQFGTIVMEIMRICADSGVSIPKEMSMLGKALLNLDKVGKALSPNFDPNKCIRKNIDTYARKRALENLNQGDLASYALELKELLSKSPQRVNDILTHLAENRFRVDVDAIDEKALIFGFQKIANRISLGAIISALVVGASIMMDIDSEFEIWGHPGFAMLLFMTAGLSTVLFVMSIFRSDR